jgi:hypothetical protein
MINYCEIVDKALGHEMSQHRTLRTCLDPGSSEWNETTMEEKVEILKKVSAVKDLNRIFLLYKREYQEMGKPYVAKGLEDGLTQLLKYLLKK